MAAGRSDAFVKRRAIAVSGGGRRGVVQGAWGLCVGFPFHAASAGAGWATVFAWEVRGACRTAGGILTAHRVLPSDCLSARVRRRFGWPAARRSNAFVKRRADTVSLPASKSVGLRHRAAGCCSGCKGFFRGKTKSGFDRAGGVDQDRRLYETPFPRAKLGVTGRNGGTAAGQAPLQTTPRGKKLKKSRGYSVLATRTPSQGARTEGLPSMRVAERRSLGL